MKINPDTQKTIQNVCNLIKLDKKTAISLQILYNIFALAMFYNRVFLWLVKHIYYHGALRIEILSILAVTFILCFTTIAAHFIKHFTRHYLKNIL